ncbi:TPA: phage tail protein [Escherichia coli]|uniref:tail protein X n=1 Tax=Escherichia coli TaxID=562 RepID=UPI0005B34C2F|nr:tail protein X [Escherichia coli]EES3796553.1 phage tail protein [Escherichia coli]EFC9842895.1 phage tail protein [Escherichia coli]EFG2177000.1 phage tail protein [Escherichia coli]EFJ5712511.1 phage tail protein [Escherichia coli]EFK1930346.1 phage tail protein [Escherichia coli]
MTITYTTRDGDRLDQICLAVYGRTRVTTETVLYQVSNYGVTDMCAVFPAGQIITLPEIEPEPIKKETQLWD